MSESERSFIIRGAQNDLLNNYIAITSQIHIEGRNDEMRSSPIRRTFCLIVLFDLVLSVLAWILRIEISHRKVTFVTEVMNYRFTNSLFDTVLLAVVRFIFLEIMYGGVKSKLPWWIALSTTISSIFVLAKMLISYFKTDEYQLDNGQDLMYFIPIILTIILCWSETLFLVCKMLPKERAAEQISQYQRSLSGQFATSTQSLVSTNPVCSEYGNRLSPTSVTDDEEFYSPGATRTGSPSQIRRHEIHNLAHSLNEKALDMIKNHTGWTYATGDAVQGCVTYKEIVSYKGKIFKIEALLDISANILYNDLISNYEQSHSWNPHTRLAKKIESISDNIDIVYNVTNEALKGYISSRDFVLLRTWKVIDNDYLIATTSFNHGDYPPQDDLVRGVNALGAIYIESSTYDSGQCKYVWITNSDIKVKMFNSMIDRAMPGILLDVIEGLRQHCAALKLSH